MLRTRMGSLRCHARIVTPPLVGRRFAPQPEFNHNAETHFQLRGMHQNVACNSCHVSKIFTEAGTRCADCHADFHKRQFGAQCENCHTVFGMAREHATRSGSLESLPADRRARGGRVRFLPHRRGGRPIRRTQHAVRQLPRPRVSAKRSARSPRRRIPHHVRNLSQRRPLAGRRFDHTRFANFALTGSHQTLPCNTCHVGDHFQGVATDCASCHLSDFTKTTNPNHVAAGFPHDCATCHNTATWDGATFDHNLTKFPLTGAHTTVTCLQCHTNGQYTTISTDCVSCHLKDYQTTTSPNHVAASFPQNCQLCHTTTQWLGATFDHSTTKFPLTGKHTTTTCAPVPFERQYATLSTTCSSCHLTDYQTTNNSESRRGRIPAGLPAVPHHHAMARRHVRSQHHASFR